MHNVWLPVMLCLSTCVWLDIDNWYPKVSFQSKWRKLKLIWFLRDISVKGHYRQTHRSAGSSTYIGKISEHGENCKLWMVVYLEPVGIPISSQPHCIRHMRHHIWRTQSVGLRKCLGVRWLPYNLCLTMSPVKWNWLKRLFFTAHSVKTKFEFHSLQQNCPKCVNIATMLQFNVNSSRLLVRISVAHRVGSSRYTLDGVYLYGLHLKVCSMVGYQQFTHNFGTASLALDKHTNGIFQRCNIYRYG